MAETIKAGEVDFRDLEAKYAVEDNLSYDQYILVDGLPVVPESKLDKLAKVLAKQFCKAAPIVGGENGFNMPLDPETKMSRGFAFVECETPEGAAEIVKAFNQKKLDAKHTLVVDKMATVSRYIGGTPSEFKEPKIPDFKPLPHLKSWLTDSLGRDQAVMHSEDEVSVHWFRKDAAPQTALPPTKRFTDAYVRWSPKGTYLLSIHQQGVALHAGPGFEIVARFPHRDVRLVDFSPDEKYLVTCAALPIKVGGPFKETDEGNNIVIWSVETQAVMRTFPLPPRKSASAPPPWPAFKWSANSKYFARIAQPNTLSIYDTENFSLVGKKSMQITGIADFEFAPADIGNGQQLLAFWTPEATNQTAKVCIVNAATKEIIHNRSLFNVVRVRFIWQNEAKFLCSKIDRLTKNKKAMTSSLEIYRMTEKSMPIEVLDFKETVLDFAWEPKSDRFAMISYFEAAPVPGQQPAGSAMPMNSLRNVVSFFALEREKKLQGTWKEANRFEERTSASLKWSPRGRFLATSSMASAKINVDLWDASHEQPIPKAANCATDAAADLPINVCLLKQMEHIGAQSMSWDPSGRYLLTLAAAQEGPLGGKGFILWDLAGNALRKEQVDGLKALIWRPRPTSLLSKEARKRIGKDVKKLASEFDLQDATLSMEESEETKRKREIIATEWSKFRSRIIPVLREFAISPEEDRFAVRDGKLFVKKVTVIEEEEEELDE